MKNDGKSLEKIVRLIQETLKDKLDTVVHSNYKIENISGRKREIDILVEAVINKIHLKIAIECKSYNKPVSVEKIEAFQAKCLRIPAINKMLFVSESGYQIDAINAAKNFGIELYDLNSVDANTIQDWFIITQLGLRFNIERFILVLDLTAEQFEELKNEKASCLIFNQEGEEKPIIDLINDLILQNKYLLWNYMIYTFMKNDGSEFIGKIIQLHFRIKLENASIKSKSGKQVNASCIDAIINIWFIQQVPELTSYHTFSSQKGVIKAGHLSIETGLPNGKTDIVLTEKEIKFFNTDNKGKIRELEVIAKYDSNSDKFTY